MKSHPILKRILIALVAIIAVAGIAFGIYVSNYSHAGSVATKALEDRTGQLTNPTAVAFGNETSSTGIVLYPGGKVEYTAYAPLAEAIANKGYFVIILESPFNLAFFDVDGASGAMSRYPNIHNWYVGGHSLGGVAACMYADGNPSNLAGVILLASYSSSDLSNKGLRAISIYGDRDGVLNFDKLKENAGNLPHGYTEVVIPGGNHGQFGDYGAQEGDNPASISPEEQWERTASAIAGFIG